MKITVNNKTLQTALSKVTSVIEKRNTIPILNNVHVSSRNNTVTIQGTDLDVTIATVIDDVVIDSEDSFTCSAVMFNDIVKRLPDGDVKLEYEGDTLHVKAGRSKFKMQTLPAVDFPVPRTPELHHGFTTTGDKLKAWLDRVAFAASTEETRINLNGVYLHENEGVVRLVATDGHRLTMQDTDLPTDTTPSNGIIIPRKTISEIVKIAATGGDVYVNFSDAIITVSNEDTTLTSKLIDSVFPEYQRILPQHNDLKMVVDADDIKKASDRVASINDERTRAVRIKCAKDEIELSVKANNDNSANETIDAQCDFELEIGVNSRYLADAMTRIEGDVEFYFKDAGSPMVARLATMNCRHMQQNCDT